MDRRVWVKLKNEELEYIILDPVRYSCLWNYEFALFFPNICIKLIEEIVEIVDTNFPNGWICWDLDNITFDIGIVM
mgnify:CR=1 FL=1